MPRRCQWPTLVTLVIFPILMFMYVRLARRDEREAITEISEEVRTFKNLVVFGNTK